MKVVFRVDSSVQIGSGHLMRCLTLAERLQKEAGADIYFIMRELDGNLINLVQQKQFRTFRLPQVTDGNNLTGYASWLTVTQECDAAETIARIKDIGEIDLLVVDSYAIDATWETLLRPYAQKIMVIDDLANRKHDCDILLDQNLYVDKNDRYQGLVPQGCQLFLGPQYAILREEFYQARQNMRARDGHINNILVFFGGSDPSNETLKALQAIVSLQRHDITVNVIVGQSNPHRTQIAEFCQQYAYIYYYCQVHNMAEFMNQADLAIGAGGTVTWERCFLGLPALVIAIADNQLEAAKTCASRGIIVFLGSKSTVTTEDISKTIKDIEGQALSKIADNCRNEGKNYGEKVIFALG